MKRITAIYNGGSGYWIPHFNRPLYIPSDDDEINEPYVSWKKDNTLIQTWIWGNLAEEVLYIVTGLSTGKQMWKAPEEAFARYTKDREWCLITKLHTYKTENLSISDHLKQFKGIYDELARSRNLFLMITK